MGNNSIKNSLKETNIQNANKKSELLINEIPLYTTNGKIVKNPYNIPLNSEVSISFYSCYIIIKIKNDQHCISNYKIKSYFHSKNIWGFSIIHKELHEEFKFEVEDGDLIAEEIKVITTDILEDMYEL